MQKSNNEWCKLLSHYHRRIQQIPTPPPMCVLHYQETNEVTGLYKLCKQLIQLQKIAIELKH